MINTAELRIDNFVAYKGKPSRVNTITRHYINGKDLELFQPLFLTAIILSEKGYHKMKPGKYFKQYTDRLVTIDLNNKIVTAKATGAREIKHTFTDALTTHNIQNLLDLNYNLKF